MSLPKIGERIDTWHQGGVVLEIRPYAGKYAHWFTHVLVVSAPNTKAGKIEMAYDASNDVIEPMGDNHDAG